MQNPFRHASVADHSKDKPDLYQACGAPTWVTRGTNFVIAVTRAKEGTRLVSQNLPDEHFVLLPNAPAHIAAGHENAPAGANHLVIVPPGDSEIIAQAEGLIVRCYSARNAQLLARAGNLAAFFERADNVAPMQDWPAPRGGFKLRVYNLSEGLVEGDKTRVYRSSNLMINILRERTIARDQRTMSPHHHDDFEQGSITLSGVHIHYLRTPWGPDLSIWRPDEAVEVGAPSVTVIPPPLIHTTRNLGDGPALLVDVFCPPRADFSLRPGMVRNADEYPLPPGLEPKS